MEPIDLHQWPHGDATPPPAADIYVHYRPVPDCADDADYLEYLWPPAAGADDIPTTDTAP